MPAEVNSMYDVIVLGGGPAGVASAISLARAARSVIVLERTRSERSRPGETFGGELGPLSQTARRHGVDRGAGSGAVPWRSCSVGRTRPS